MGYKSESPEEWKPVAILTVVLVVLMAFVIHTELTDSWPCRTATLDNLRPSSIVVIEAQWNGTWQQVEVVLPPADAYRLRIPRRTEFTDGVER